LGFGFEIGIAAALALDACAVTLALAVALGGLTKRQTFRLVWHFALFQAAMPVIGWFSARLIDIWIRDLDHWVAFVLLLVVGGKMVLDGIQGSEISTKAADPTRGWSLVLLSVATSIDALAVGLSIGLLGESIWRSAALIGWVTAVMTLAVAVIGGRLRLLSTRPAAIVGGVVLIVIGCRFLVAHLTGG